MTPDLLNTIALGLGVIGLACFAWPILLRVSGKAPAEPAGSGRSLRSPLWWAGFVLTIAAIALQRYAQAGV
ncbi:MAG: hypothetical protein ACK4VM_11205 [Bosea sp. (in: a-proteobacteria)]